MHTSNDFLKKLKKHCYRGFALPKDDFAALGGIPLLKADSAGMNDYAGMNDSAGSCLRRWVFCGRFLYAGLGNTLRADLRAAAATILGTLRHLSQLLFSLIVACIAANLMHLFRSCNINYTQGVVRDKQPAPRGHKLPLDIVSRSSPSRGHESLYLTLVGPCKPTVRTRDYPLGAIRSLVCWLVMYLVSD